MPAPTLAGVATVRGARGAPGPTYTRARGTKNEPTSEPAPPSPYPSFIRRRSSNARWGNLYDVADPAISRPELVFRIATDELLGTVAEAMVRIECGHGAEAALRQLWAALLELKVM